MPAPVIISGFDFNCRSICKEIRGNVAWQVYFLVSRRETHEKPASYLLDLFMNKIVNYGLSPLRRFSLVNGRRMKFSTGDLCRCFPSLNQDMVRLVRFQSIAEPGPGLPALGN